MARLTLWQLITVAAVAFAIFGALRLMGWL